METGVDWEKIEHNHNYCVEALEDTAVTGSTFKLPCFAKVLLCICIYYPGVLKFETLPCYETSASADKNLRRVPSFFVKMENCLSGSVYGIINLSTGSSLNSFSFIMFFVRTGK